ncbi:MAG: hypothetical protein ACT4PN_04075 [Nitrospiraceae bacterium]
MMRDVTLWSLWYGILVTLPPVITRMLIKHAMARAVTPRRVLSLMERKQEVRHGILKTDHSWLV